MKFKVTSPYGVLEEVRDHAHNGIDLAMPEGTPLRSIAEGVVERVVDYGDINIGKGVIIRLEDGTRHIYGHLSKVEVKAGEHVNAGELIGISGNTGHSTGAHLHFGVWKDGHFVDPTALAEKVSAYAGNITSSDLPLWDIDGRFNLFLQQTADNMTEYFKQQIIDFLTALCDVFVDLSYSITLVGGGILIILYAVSKSKRFGKWFAVLYAINALITFLFK